MSSIEACRTEALGGHVAACTKCKHHHIAYNSCKNRHCPKCQGPAARDWMAAGADDLLPVEYFHVAFTLPAEVARIAYWNKKVIYGLLFRASAQTVITIAADPKTAWCARWYDQCPAYMGFGADPSPPCPHDCSGWRPVAKWQPLGRVQTGVLFARAGVVTALSTPIHRRTAGAASRRQTGFLR